MNARPAPEHAPDFDRESIAAHYDVSNEFYATFLDRNMVYTCAYFDDLASTDLDRAQEAKLDLVCRKLRLKQGERLLDIGCGWGALSIHAARRYGVEAYGVTLSERQAAFARDRIRREGLEKLCRVEMRDARTLASERSRFDKIAAVGVLEHIGIWHYPEFFAMVKGLLEDDGAFLNHAIANRPGTVWDASTDFICRTIFGNAEFAPLSLVLDRMERAGFEVADVEDLRWHYQRTCTLWARRLQAAHDEAVRHASERTYRLWLLYLAGSAVAFEQGDALLYQTLAIRHRRAPSPLPPTRDDIFAARRTQGTSRTEEVRGRARLG